MMRFSLPLACCVVICCSAFLSADEGDLPKAIDHEIVGKLVLIPEGKFLMGSKIDDPGNRADERPQHEVTIEQPFYMGIHEVTFSQFRRFFAATGYKTDAERDGIGGWGYDPKTRDFERPPLKFSWRNTGFEQFPNSPVVNVSWNDAVKFCAWLSAKDGKHVFRLPTEAEWEYACRAGTKARYIYGNTSRSLIKRENIADRSLRMILSKKTKIKGPFAKWTDRYPFTAPVGSFRSNKFGLYDMNGNVAEWCEDFYLPDRYLKPDNFRAITGKRRVWRGGSCLKSPERSTSARRSAFPPNDRWCHIGFRIVREVD